MRKLKLQMQISVDGFVSGPNGEMDWMVWNWDDALKKYVNDLTEPVDCIVMGRKLATGFIPHWKSVAGNPDDPQYTFGRKMMDTPKIIFSKTLKKSEWDNAKLVKGNLADEMAQLKKQPGKDIIVYGGAGFVSNLIRGGLIDQLYLFVNPVALGKNNGMSIFSTRTNLQLIDTTSFSCGIFVLNYKPLKNNHK